MALPAFGHIGRLRNAALALLVSTTFAAQNLGAIPVPAPSEAQAPSPDNPTENIDIYGRWRIEKVLGAADVAAMSDRQARALVGKKIDVRKEAFVFNGEVCEAPTYERAVEGLAKSFREQGHASAATTGLPDPVTSIDARCTHIFLKRPGVIVVHWDGYYFDAVRQAR